MTSPGARGKVHLKAVCVQIHTEKTVMHMLPPFLHSLPVLGQGRSMTNLKIQQMHLVSFVIN